MLRNFDGSWNKDLIFKILFAIEVAFLPMILSAHFMMNRAWMIVFLSVVIASKLAMVLLKDQANHTHIYLDSIGNVVVMAFVMIAYAGLGYLNLPLAIVTSVVVGLEELLRVFFFYKPNKQYIDALNFACEMFMYLVLGGALVVFWTDTLILIGAIALLMCSTVITVIQGYNYVYFYLIKKNKRIKNKKNKR